MTAGDLIRSSLRSAGVVASGEVADASTMADAKESLNMLLASWSAERLIIHSVAWETKTLVVADGDYTWGAGGDIATERPIDVLSAFIRDATRDYFMDILTEREYLGLGSKSLAGQPTELYYKPSYPLGILYLYPVPDAAYSIHMQVLRPLDSIGALTADITVPPEYQQALKTNLAIMIAIEWGRAVDQALASVAETSKRRLLAANAAQQLESVKLGMFSLGLPYNIETGQ